MTQRLAEVLWELKREICPKNSPGDMKLMFESRPKPASYSALK